MGGYIKNGAEAVYITGAGATINSGSAVTPIGAHTKNSSLSSAVTLTPAAGANALIISIEDQPVRIRMDGSDADSSTGFKFSDGDILTFQFSAGTVFSVIETTATATIQYQWGTI